MKAEEHPAWAKSLQSAIRRARVQKPDTVAIYFDGENVFVRMAKAAPPANARVVCMAQQWDDDTVQLRFEGARSEWIKDEGCRC